MKCKKNKMRMTAEQYPNLLAAVAAAESQRVQKLIEKSKSATDSMVQACVAFLRAADAKDCQKAARLLCAAYHRLRRASKALQRLLTEGLPKSKVIRRFQEMDHARLKVRLVVEDKVAKVMGDAFAMKKLRERGRIR